MEPWYTTQGTDADDLYKDEGGFYDVGQIKPDKFGPYSTEYAESKGYRAKPTINLPEAEIRVGEGYSTSSGSNQLDHIVNSDDYYDPAYHPFIPRAPDNVGINLSGSLLFGGGASGGIGLHLVRNEGLVFTYSVGGGIGLDLGAGPSISWGYATQGPQSSNLNNFLGTDLSAGGQYIIGLAHSRDLTRNPRTGQQEVGQVWQGYQLGIGAEVKTGVQITHTKGVSLQQLLDYFKAPKNYNIE